MFVAQKEMPSMSGLVKVGDKMAPEMFDAASALALVDAGAVKWVGEGGKYGPHSEAAHALSDSMAKKLSARMAKLEKAEPRAMNERAKLASEVDGLKAENAELKARLLAIESRLNKKS